MRALLSVLSLLLVLGSSRALAFPDMIRHGYTNCTTCHVSPAGGGLLNPYGRSLSKELLSTWGYKGEENPLHGLVELSESAQERVAIGGDARYISLRTKDEPTEVDEGFLMQAQARVGILFEKVKVLVTVGKIENPRESDTIHFVSPEHYVLWTPEEKVHLRFGRFEPIYGLRMPDHNLWVKSDIGFVPWLERDTAEFIYEGETQFASVAGFQSKSSVSFAEQTTGYTGSLYQILGERTRVGVSGMNSEGQNVRARSVSVHATVGFSEKTYLLAEAGRVWNLDSTKDVSFLRFGHEVLKGFTPIAQAQARVDRSTTDNDQYRYGAGFIWMPRPHFEFMGLAEEVRKPDEVSKAGMLLVHYYL